MSELNKIFDWHVGAEIYIADEVDAEIAKLKELLRKAVPIVSKVSGIEAHTLWKELREAAK